MPEFHSPIVLALFVPIALGAWLLARRRRSPTVRFPTTKGIRPARTLRLRLLAVPRILRALAVVLVLLAGARPRMGEAKTAIRREGLAVQMVLDRSGSMEEEMPYEGRSLPKIAIVRSIFDDFVAGGGDLPGRPNDLVGLTTFARFAEENCPLVALHEPLLTAVENLRTTAPFLTAERSPTWDQSQARYENPLNATAIGEGMKRAVLALVAAEEDLARSRGKEGTGYRIRGKVAILLTDGKNNAGSDPLEAAALAKANDVKVYSIVLAARDVIAETMFGQRVRQRLSDAQMAEMTAGPEAMAKETGGRFFLATDGNALREIYREIDRLEKVDVGELEFTTYHEWFALPLLAGIVLLILAQALDETWLRRTP